MASKDLSKKYYKISDVAEILGISASTIRFWENEFPEVSPMRSVSNQRFYTPEDIETLRIIYFLLKIKGLKIDAAKEQMRLNRNNISKRAAIVEKLQDVKDELTMMLKALEKRR
ncbi:MAG: MerR family transcriptional regulator [Muribaculaceae bacterium]|nr:MerR family transcriptional regulator [Muribaculaceae bacterium]MDE6754570.1 MerR family transcriptional regulator [Muribaculaceae bacterium]